MLKISVVSNIQSALNKLAKYDESQLRFAAAKSLTVTAKEIQTSVRASMPQRFTLRRNWIVQGIRVKYATKTNLKAEVGSIDPFMERQETGGIKTGQAGGGNFTASGLPGRSGARGRVAIPTAQVLRTKRDIIRKSELPSGLGAKAFVIKGKDGAELLARRFAKGKRAGLQAMYVLKPSTRVKPRLGLFDIGRKVIERRFEKIFLANLEAAQASAKARTPVSKG